MMLEDDRKKYNMGTEEPVDPMKEAINNLMGLGISKKEIDIIRNNTVDSDAVRKIIVRTEKDMGVEPGNLFEAINMIAKKKEERAEMKEGGPGIEALRQVAPEVVERMGYEEGGSIDDQMMMVMTPPMESEMESDEDMEDGYTRFIMEEALTEDEEDMLMSKLEQDEELAMLFDKVIDVAQEFAGAGPVEGPGSGVSDSIPARLSDGEFVFTAKAVEEIGADNLMAMMKDAEAKADKRQPLQEGGELKEETMAIKTPMTEQVIRVEKSPQTEQVGVSGSLLDSVREEDNPLYEEMPFKRPPVHGAGYGR